ncbi:hypothetical protein E8E13_006163 [Curvularia kusanoi]|uniref:Peptidase S54 rhomboid domain-containing protein n=1 Tax=Curvularia kusanoi TaxID=90978 RepID=A0A9P4THW3_CURKU|nr:hypothetical protein E8E13_006163 [Curvularia kusanoi]
MARPCPALRKPLSASFFSTATPRRPFPCNFFKQPSSTSLSRVKQTRSKSSGSFGHERRTAANLFILKGFIAINVAVFGFNIYTGVQAKQGYVDNFRKYIQNMTLNLRDFKNGYFWEPLTCIFAHADLMHIGFNMFTFWSLGRGLCMLPVTPGQFTFIVLGSGLAGSLSWLAQKQMRVQTGLESPNTPQRAMGFSGALMGTISVVASFMPREKIYFFGVVPVPLWLCVVGYGVYDGYYVNSEVSRTAHSGHLGGLAFGLAYYFLRLRRLRFPGSI